VLAEACQHRGVRRRLRGIGAAVPAVAVACLLVFPRLVPNAAGHLGSLLETFLPWLGLSVPLLATLAWWRRSRIAALAVLLTVAAWLGVFGGHLIPDRDSAYDLTAVQHNVSDVNADPAGTVRELVKVRPDLIALEELTPAALPAYLAAMPPEYAHHTVQGTVGLWSRYPLTEAGLVDIRPRAFGADWNRGLRAVAQLPGGDVAVYVAHLPSVRIGVRGFGSAPRDESAARLGAVIAAEPRDRVILLGDLNETVDDRSFAPISSQLRTVRSAFAFTWPARAPVARIDQILARSVTVTAVRALPATGSDHLPLAAHLRF
jgi:vancomycin resistance protein VanJ